MNGHFKSELGDLADPAQFGTPIDISAQDPQRLIRQLQMMLTVRRAEESIAELIEEGCAHTPCHLGIGQEAIAVGVCATLKNTDRVFGGHRSHGPFLALGCKLEELMCEVLGKAAGCAGGMGGSMHLTDPQRGFWGSVPIVAGTVSIAVGAALSAKMDGGDSVAVCFFGDGAIEEGSIHESLNLASVYQLPVIFVCENNFYASHMDISQRQPSDRTARFADAHKIEAEEVDGNDVVAVFAAARRLVERARAGQGPGYLEAVTYRWRGHVGPSEDIDVGVRRKPDHLIAWKKRDPIARLKNALIQQNFLDDERYDELCETVRQRVEQAKQMALSAPYPEAAAILDLVYAEN